MSQTIFNSQHNEDLILAEIFNKTEGFYVEVGDYDGIKLSNTHFFEKIGWGGIIVEPIPHLYEKIKQQRQCIVVQAAAGDEFSTIEFTVPIGREYLAGASSLMTDHDSSLEKFAVQQVTLDSILEQNNISEIDFISIDVEGAEYSVLKGFSVEVYNPRIIIVEENERIGADLLVHKHLLSKGYLRFRSTGCNHWYAKENDNLVNFIGIISTTFSINMKNLRRKLLPQTWRAKGLTFLRKMSLK